MTIQGKKVSTSVIVIFVFLIAIPPMNFNHHIYSRPEGVIVWDIKSYYAYLPAAFIFKDLNLHYVENDIEKFSKWVWPITTPTGKKAILTTMGLSVMYSPFFFIAHQFVKMSSTYEPDGYSLPYHIALTFSAYVYFILALFILRFLLLKHFSELTTTITMLTVGAGTNLLHYVTYEAPMSHGYNFFLIILFIYLLDKWYEDYRWKSALLLGLVGGLITLIRPTNVIILLFIPLYKINSFQSLKINTIDLLKKWPKIVIMAIAFILVWVPQFVYWYKISGEVFYFSYGEVGSAFYFLNPQITDILFSYKKGWFIYTPVMLLATLGIFFLFKQKRSFSVAILCYFLINLYLLSTWWSWWFGGGFSNRAFIDGYGIMAFPLAAFLEEYKIDKIKKTMLISLILLLTAFNLFQIQQYRRGSIHWFWMNKEAYWENFLKLSPTCKYWNILNMPNVEKARKGIYEATFFVDSKVTREDLFEKVSLELEFKKQIIDSIKTQSNSNNESIEKLKFDYINNKINSGSAKQEYKELRIDYLMVQMRNCDTWKKEIEKKTKKWNLTFEEMSKVEAERIFNNYSQKYIKESY